MNRDYIAFLEGLPCSRKPQKVTWMGGWAPLPEEIDLPAYGLGRIARISGIPRVRCPPVALGQQVAQLGDRRRFLIIP